MTPVAQTVLVLCAVVLTVAIVATLLSFKRTAARAEIVLQLVEREIRPLASQIEGLAGDLRVVAQTTNGSVQRLNGILGRVEDISLKVARIIGVANSLTSLKGISGVASGAKTGLSVFLSRLTR
ncbi:MAG: hypothetical protein DMD77_24105 [Candidatus Rokuibacteriota bacterium]|nr:MAG: hypothetical protein DME16_22300 [Candidatus Rokubacteria bacterium]PYM54221.1 MAG: hypothetical protein DMD77_24105 [Candidatus Rokubacteria bacterium]